MDDVESFANHINQNWEKLDGLVNNAGGALLTKSPSAFMEKNGQKYCSQFIGNHVGPFHLTNLLLPLLEKTDGSRIINLSSVMHDQAKGMQSSRAVVDFDDIHYRNKKFDGFEAYAQSKLANLPMQSRLLESTPLIKLQSSLSIRVLLQKAVILAENFLRLCKSS